MRLIKKLCIFRLNEKCLYNRKLICSGLHLENGETIFYFHETEEANENEQIFFFILDLNDYVGLKISPKWEKTLLDIEYNISKKGHILTDLNDWFVK